MVGVKALAVKSLVEKQLIRHEKKGRDNLYAD